MEQGLNFENGQIIRYGDGLAKIVLNYEQTQAVELLKDNCFCLVYFWAIINIISCFSSGLVKNGKVF